MFAALRSKRARGNHATMSLERAPASARLLELGLREEAWGARDWKLRFSSDERAMMEFLQDVPARASIYDANLFMQSLVSLRPGTVSRLLRTCTSVKVKRLFLALGDRHGHAWFKRIELTGVDLGKGKRMLVPGGKLRAAYLITLPADLDDHAR